ncbi:peptide MFS transporter [Isosphaeraceae bacterium EP7]
MSPEHSRAAAFTAEVAADIDAFGPNQHSVGGPGSGGGPLDFLRQPKGLYALFFTEMWERFSFYLMIALLSLYLTESLGFADARASDVATWYLSLVYFTPFLGGLIADRLTGYVKAILIGGTLMMFGHLVLALDTKESASHPFLFAALGLLIAGNGMFKPNISTMVGNLYSKTDPRRDRGFTIFYMGINLGAFVAPLAGNFLRTRSVDILNTWFGTKLPADAGWHIAFGSAGVGMLLSLATFLAFKGRLNEGRPDDDGGYPDTSAPVIETRGDRRLKLAQWFNMGAIGLALTVLLAGPSLGLPVTVIQFGAAWLVIELVTVVMLLTGGDRMSADAAKLKTIFVIVALFWMAFHQNSVALTFFVRDYVQSSWDTETFQSINPLCILLFSPLMVALWSYLGPRKLEPSSTGKMAIGMLITALAYGVMVAAAGRLVGPGAKVSAGWLVGCYALITVAELLVSPIGLSLTSKLAPDRYRGLWMGFWFLATAVGNKLVHVVGGFWGKYPPGQLFTGLVVSSVAAALALVVSLQVLKAFEPKDGRA